MKRVRLIVETIIITQRSEINFFDLRLPNNTLRLLALESDVFVQSSYAPPAQTNSTTLEWKAQRGICAGKLKLRTAGLEGIFYESWVNLIPYAQGLPDMTFGHLPLGTLTLDRQSRPRLTNLPCKHLLIEGLFQDKFGEGLQQDIQYEVRIFLWVETEELSKGLTFGFDNQSAGKETNNLNLLQIKL